MNYYLDIYDTTDDTHTTVLENARANSILLSWEGKDAIDELDVVGSSLRFTLEAKHNANDDGAFIHLFTGNEVKYRVDLRLEEDDSLVWQGFVLPDAYNEPYKPGNFFVGVEATDGLGRLKGKYLPDTYYEDENRVTDIIAACLEQTGLQFDIVVAPGIDNKTQKYWDSIFIDGLNYVENNRKWTAYKILQTFLQDTLSCLYQYKGVWYLEGLNKRNLTEYTAKRYTYQGYFVSNETVVKTIKDIDGKILGAGNVTMVPPYNNVTVTHQATTLQFPATIDKEVNDGWVTEAAGVSGVIYATDWYPNNVTFLAKAKTPDYKVFLESNNEETPDFNKYVQLRSKIYVKQDTKLKFSLKLSLDYYDSSLAGTVTELIDDGYWTNNIYYKIQVGGETLFTNIGDNVTNAETIQFNDDYEADIAFEFIIPESGLFDVWLYQPYHLNDYIRSRGVFIDEMTIEHIGFDEDIIYQDTINENYTVDKEHDVVFADAASGLGNVFLLAKLRNATNNWQVIPVYITHSFQQNGNNYSVVSLEGANFIADNIDSVFKDNVNLENLEVIYNYGGGEQMVVKTDTLYSSGAFTVFMYRINDYTQDRTTWEEWTDSVYEIERKRFPEAAMGVFSRLFENPIAKLDATVKEIVMFGELINWTYMDETSVFIPTNCTYNLDKGVTNIVAPKASYLQVNTLVPPYVDAGPDIYLYGSESTVNFDATAYDPDGTIVTYLWEHVSGSPAGTIVSAATEDTQVTGLTGDIYEYKITVTDNDGLTASDTIVVYRVTDYTASLSITDSNDVSEGWPYYENTNDRLYRIVVSPTLPDDLLISFTANITLETSITDTGAAFKAEATVTITKNGTLLQTWYQDGVTSVSDYETTFSFIAGDEIDIYIKAFNQDYFLPNPPNPPIPDYETYARAAFNLDFGTITGFPGTVLGLPSEVEVIATNL